MLEQTAQNPDCWKYLNEQWFGDLLAHEHQEWDRGLGFFESWLPLQTATWLQARMAASTVATRITHLPRGHHEPNQAAKVLKPPKS